MADIFISYSRTDREFVTKLADVLTTCGFSVWWDLEMVHGEYFDRAVEQEIENATVVIVVWSSAGRESNWCRAEAAAALEQNKLLPISIHQAKPPIRFTHIHTADLSAWNGDVSAKSFQLVCRDLRKYGVKIHEPSQASIPDIISEPDAGKVILKRVRSAAFVAILIGAVVAAKEIHDHRDLEPPSERQQSKAVPSEAQGKAEPKPDTIPLNLPFAEALLRINVQAAQGKLNTRGYGPLDRSGKIDSATKAALEKFQRDTKLPVTGTLDQATAKALLDGPS
jgi:hypothetical protein